MVVSVFFGGKYDSSATKKGITLPGRSSGGLGTLQEKEGVDTDA